jgi:hypothetical protein
MTPEQLMAYFMANYEYPQYFRSDLAIQVCVNPNGMYYIGQMEDGSPYSRLSCEYFGTAEDAELAMISGNFTPKLWP